MTVTVAARELGTYTSGRARAERVAPAEELAGARGLGDGELVVQRHAPRGSVEPEPVQRFERPCERRGAGTQALPLLVLELHVTRRVQRHRRKRKTRRVHQ